MRVWDETFGYGVADRAKGVETFGDGPREAFLLGFVLQVAGSEIDGEGVGYTLLSISKRRRSLSSARSCQSRRLTVNGVYGPLLIFLIQILHLPPHNQRQLNFIVQGDTPRAKDRSAFRRED